MITRTVRIIGGSLVVGLPAQFCQVLNIKARDRMIIEPRRNGFFIRKIEVKE